ncbi:MAG: malonyl-CoA decarboxylase [Alphaproteobacteria bacterium]|jgi:malonyl-CoA decarboxylase
MTDTLVAPNRFLERTRDILRRALANVVSVASRRHASLRPDLPDDDLERLRAQIDECLEASGGEVLARANAANLGRTYLGLNTEGRKRFFSLLVNDYGVDKVGLGAAMAAVHDADDDNGNYSRAVARLRETLVPPRLTLMRKFNSLESGIKFVIDMRADLLDLTRDNPEFRAFDREVRSLLHDWFDVGFLQLERISWAAPASLLEKLIAYEAVHEIRSWDDLKHRLESDRRCYAFFHPSMPDEPLIFVEVALVYGIADNILKLLDANGDRVEPDEANTAIFYSISNAQKGLAGVGFGDFLIKRVVDDLSRELPNIKTFSTLSPIPGFLRWLDERLADGADLLTHEEEDALDELVMPAPDQPLLSAALALPDWPHNEALDAALKPILLRLAAGYLLYQRRDGSKALDPVAHFHLSNGARVERLNWHGDLSAKGLKQSAGMMVNYLYGLDRIEANHEAYVSGGDIPASSSVRNLV